MEYDMDFLFSGGTMNFTFERKANDILKKILAEAGYLLQMGQTEQSLKAKIRAALEKAKERNLLECADLDKRIMQDVLTEALYASPLTSEYLDTSRLKKPDWLQAPGHARGTEQDKRPSAPDLPSNLAELDALTIPFLAEFGTWPYPAAVLGFSAVFYFYSPDVPPESVIRCIDDYVQRVGDKLTLRGEATSRHEEGEFYPFGLSAYKLPTEQDVFESPTVDEKYKTSWYLLSGGKSEKHPAHYALSCHYSSAYSERDLCRIQFCLPMSFVAQKGTVYLRDMLEKWTALLRPFHGAAGVGFIYAIEPVCGDCGSGSVIPFLQRYPGLQTDADFRDVVTRLDGGIKGVSWFTMVSDELLEKIGGRKALEALGDDFTLWSYPGGVGIMAGETPELGDNESGLVPHHAVRLHQILRPLYSPQMVRLISYPPGDLDVIAFTKAWMFRYDAFCQNREEQR